MSRHPVVLMVPAALCVLLASFCLGLALFANPRDADTFVLLGAAGALFFGCRAVTETRQAWRPFTAGLACRRALRHSAPLTRINLPKDDIR
ncbi:hypothetical protein ABE583_03000 [Stenotrophomonas sp. TWI143]|uniref:hypothetical protein n=1 Tax=Stenotrophomonas sp. TWI143 TaxID=3136771 RepID=UPI00320A8B7F